MSRLKICAGNWKLNKSPKEVEAFFAEWQTLFQNRHCETVIFPPAYDLVALGQAATRLPVFYGPQNIHFANSGAFTGELSPQVVKEMGAKYALIGHSERRTYFHESNELCAKKIAAAMAVNLVPMLCVGETLAERESNQTEEVVKKQICESLSGLENILNSGGSGIVIAYEPVWAIGTGKVATPEQAEAVHSYIRQVLSEMFGNGLAKETSILYGGSVNAESAKDLIRQPNIDGFLVGGASLKPHEFEKIRSVF